MSWQRYSGTPRDTTHSTHELVQAEAEIRPRADLSRSRIAALDHAIEAAEKHVRVALEALGRDGSHDWHHVDR